VTGVLSRKREDVHADLRAAGATIHDSVKKDTTYLLAGDKTGKSKLDQAKRYGTKVITEAEMQLLVAGSEAPSAPEDSRAHGRTRPRPAHLRRHRRAHRRDRHSRRFEELEPAQAHHGDTHLARRASSGKRTGRDQGTHPAERAGRGAGAVQRPPRGVGAHHGA